MDAKTVAEFADELARLRGRCRVRTLDTADLLQALDEARRTGDGTRCGGHVANAYGYPATTMRLAAVRLPSGDYGVKADWGNATRGSAVVPVYGGERPYRKLVAEAQAATTRDAEDAALVDWTRLVGADVRRALVRWRREAAQRAAQFCPPRDWPETVLVTVQDSLDAGNCPSETARVARWFPGRTAVSAAALRVAVLRREPTLLGFARKAVEQATRRAAAVAA